MKRRSKIIICSAVLIVVIAAFVFYNQKDSISSLPYVTTLSGQSAANYSGEPYYDYQFASYTEFNPKDYNLSDYKFNYNLTNHAISLENGRYLAFLYGGPSINNTPVQEGIIVILDTSTNEATQYLFPDNEWAGTQSLDRIGNNLFLHYSSASLGDVFYIFNMDTRTFSPLLASSSIMTYHSTVYVSVNPDNQTEFAMSFCTKAGSFNPCSQYGYAISDSISIHKLFNTSLPLPYGWNNNMFFVKDSNEVYIVDSAKLN